jgi:hypothetical protein
MVFDGRRSATVAADDPACDFLQPTELQSSELISPYVSSKTPTYHRPIQESSIGKASTYYC